MVNEANRRVGLMGQLAERSKEWPHIVRTILTLMVQLSQGIQHRQRNFLLNKEVVQALHGCWVLKTDAILREPVDGKHQHWRTVATIHSLPYASLHFTEMILGRHEQRWAWCHGAIEKGLARGDRTDEIDCQEGLARLLASGKERERSPWQDLVHQIL
jgi:hypothetical protein